MRSACLLQSFSYDNVYIDDDDDDDVRLCMQAMPSLTELSITVLVVF
jgi:hypothetical protein